MKHIVIAFTSLFFFLVSSSTLAEGAMSLEQIEKLEGREKVTQILNQIEVDIGSFAKQRKLDCIKAVGYKPFCACILEHLPIAWSFSDYVAITTKSKEENQYGKMDKDYQEAYEKVTPIRDKCVYEINNP
jgi:hypothetical protein